MFICRKINYLKCHHMTLIQFFDLKGTRHKPFIQTSVNRMSQLAYVSALSISKNISLSSRSHDPFKHGLLRPRLFGESTGFRRWAYLEIALIKTRAAKYPTREITIFNSIVVYTFGFQFLLCSSGLTYFVARLAILEQIPLGSSRTRVKTSLNHLICILE